MGIHGVGGAPQGASSGETEVAVISVVVPRDIGTERAAPWEWLAVRYAALHPSWQVVEGYCSGPWSKGTAVADGLKRATGEIIIVADADSFCGRAVLELAVDYATHVPWVMPHAVVERLGPEATERILAGPVIDQPAREHALRHDAPVGGGIVVARREVLDAVPLDPRFVGWGGDDISWGRALDVLAGRHVNLGASLWHLHHPPSSNRRQATPETEALAGRYLDAAGDPVAMQKLADEARTALNVIPSL